jgi:hypothetical protein
MTLIRSAPFPQFSIGTWAMIVRKMRTVNDKFVFHELPQLSSIAIFGMEVGEISEIARSLFAVIAELKRGPTNVGINNFTSLGERR